MPQPQIQLTALEKKFGHDRAVWPLTLAINKGEFVVLLGPSGCGKTTTLRMIAGLESPTAGTVAIAGRDVTGLPPGQRDIAFVFQLFALYPHLSVQENIAFPLRAIGLAHREALARARQTAARLSIMHLLDMKPRALSGGDQQRVALARAMVRNPAAFLMDEPLGTLDADEREATRAQLRALHNELAAEGRVSGHELSPARRISPAAVQIEGTPIVLRAPDSSDGRDAENLTLGIRPEHIHLSPSGSPGFVEHAERLGAYNLLEIGLGPHSLKARVPAGAAPADNQAVAISFAPAGVRWFDPRSGAALAT